MAGRWRTGSGQAVGRQRVGGGQVAGRQRAGGGQAAGSQTEVNSRQSQSDSHNQTVTIRQTPL